MTSLEYTYWQAFNRLEPLTVQESLEYVGAQLERTLVNIHRDTQRHPEPFGLRDFLLFRPAPEPTDEELEQRLFALFPVTPETRH